MEVMLGWQSNKGVRVSSPSCFMLRLGNSCRPYLLEREKPPKELRPKNLNNQLQLSRLQTDSLEKENIYCSLKVLQARLQAKLTVG